MANWGIGIGSFAEGFTRGMSARRQLNELTREEEADLARKEAEKARKEALDAARKERNATIEAETDRILGIGEWGPPEPGAAAAPQAAAAAQPAAAPGAQPIEPPPQGQPLPDQGATPTAAQAATTPAASATATPAATGSVTPQVRQAAAPAQSEATPMAAAGMPQIPLAARGISQPAPAMSREQARALAEKKAPSVIEFFQKKGVPKIAETFLAQGDVAKAEAWTKWAEESQNKRNMARWAKAWRATQTGDFEGAADQFFELYKGLDDGVTPISKEVVKDKDGNVTGFNVKLKDDDTGEERSTFIGRDQLLDMGLAALSPPQLFEAQWKRREAQEKAERDARAEVGKAKLKFQTDVALENVRQGGRVALEDRRSANDMERDERKAALDAKTQRNKVQQELDAKVGALKNAGYSDEFIKEALPQILGVGTYKKATAPEEARRMAFSDRMKNDPRFARLSADEQRKKIDEDIALIYGGMKPSSAPGGSTGASSGAATPNPAARGLPVLDTKTGKIIYR